jgi:multimeric flavodoxin WrbA
VALRALALNCTLTPSTASSSESSTERLAREVLDALGEHGVAGSMVRVVDVDVRPGVQLDMGDGDQWPLIRRQIMDSDILVIATPTWMGQHSSVCQRVFERLDAELSEKDDQGRLLTYGKVGLAVIVGNEDGAHHITAIIFQALNDVGFTIPAGGVTYWNGEAMHTTDYKDLGSTPETVAGTTASLAANAAHVAALLKEHPYPPVG